jgi:hypothetical protein
LCKAGRNKAKARIELADVGQRSWKTKCASLLLF